MWMCKSACTHLLNIPVDVTAVSVCVFYGCVSMWLSVLQTHFQNVQNIGLPVRSDTNVVTYESPDIQNMFERNLIPKWPSPGIMMK